MGVLNVIHLACIGWLLLCVFGFYVFIRCSVETLMCVIFFFVLSCVVDFVEGKRDYLAIELELGLLNGGGIGGSVFMTMMMVVDPDRGFRCFIGTIKWMRRTCVEQVERLPDDE